YCVESPDLRAYPLLLSQVMASQNSQLIRLQGTDTYKANWQKSNYMRQNAYQHVDLQMEQDGLGQPAEMDSHFPLDLVDGETEPAEPREVIQPWKPHAALPVITFGTPQPPRHPPEPACQARKHTQPREN
ncbi:unnamed protein product, partial [Rangifer tarandus platyrhynchus]